MFEDETAPKTGGFTLNRAVKPPPRKARESLRVGDLARLQFRNDESGAFESLWVQVSAVGKRRYEGLVHDQVSGALLGVLGTGDLIEFGTQHITDIQRNEPT